MPRQLWLGLGLRLRMRCRCRCRCRHQLRSGRRYDVRCRYIVRYRSRRLRSARFSRDLCLSTTPTGPDGPPPCHCPEHEHGQHDQDHELADEQPPEQAVPGELLARCLRPRARDVVGLGDQGAHGQGGVGEGDAGGPGAVGEQRCEARCRPDQQGHAEEEGEYADEQAVGDASLAVPVVPVCPAVVRSHAASLPCAGPMPPSIRSRQGVVPRRPPPVPPPPARRRAGRRRSGRGRRTTPSSRGR